jgi:hypothetical protein
MTFLDFAEKVIKEEKKGLTQAEIWKIGEKKGYDKELNTKGKTPWQTLGVSLRNDVRDNPQTTRFLLSYDIPYKYYLKSTPNKPLITKDLTDEKEEIVEKKPKDNNKFLEKDLHKYLSYFVYEKEKINTKTINAQKSSKWLNSIWRHPDIVGVTYPIWEDDVFELSKNIDSYGITLYSYELKRELNSSNLREHYFEAVSNSSWANEGYLVAAIISEENEFFDEFRRLNNAFGIGLIKISMDDPSENNIVFPSRFNEKVDIESVNILSKINKDFKDFINDIISDYRNLKRLRGAYDKVFEVEELYKKQ